MSQYKAYLLSLNPEANIADQWDYGFLKDFLDDNNFEIEQVISIPKGDKAIVVIPARHHKGLESKVNEQLGNLNKAILFCMGDEEADLEIEKIELPPEQIWIQNPHMGRHDKYNKLGTGHPQHMKQYLHEPSKSLNVFFAGQITHKRREELADVLIYYEQERGNTKLVRTRGFTQGETPQEYYADMLSAKVAPCPSGAVIPDSFRLFEALECMAIPIADEVSPTEKLSGYWDWLFGQEAPFPKLTEWDRLYGLADELLADYPRNIHQITAWYIKYKRDFKNKVMELLDV